ncbi:snoRNP assembly factor Naf1 [Aspergillus sclerotialis]|uniref:H/ACA ribonucleoprotein complex non-core subunit NAF1 n=1 Tax=Aspergillus sclerotialis TaxID=2070753 RepID=A0A3A2ZB05_9EURO|nr:snoRNP assembly factor Naf1 [Aspergillus sclerotialis]
MSDIPSNPTGNTSEGPAAKQPYNIDTPPIAVTPADDGSDFYNTPWIASTPVHNEENKTSTTANHTDDSATSPKPAAQIPGLSLVNDGLNRSQPTDNGPILQENTENEDSNEKYNVAMYPSTSNNGTEGLGQQKDEPVPVTREAMEVEDAEQRIREGAVNGDSNMIDVAQAPEHADGDGEEQTNEPREWETDSSPYESSSDDTTTTDSDDSSDEDDEDYPILSAEEQARILMQAENDSDDEGAGKGKTGGHIKTANEQPEEVPPIPDVTITPDMKIVHLGHVQAIVENAVLVEANISGEYQVLESGSLLCSEDRKVVGVVSETLGRVESPLYALRYATSAEVEERGVCKGKSIYYVESHSTFVFTQPLKGMKGSDASNFHDEEIAEDEVEFSDDEAEAEHKRKLKQKQQERKKAKSGNGPGRARREPPGPSKLGQSELNYDDDAADDGYTPLARPKNLHEMMGNQEAPVESDGPPSRGGFRGGRSRGRGSDRDRGARGRGGGVPGGRHPQNENMPPQPQHYPQPPYQTPQNPYGMPQQFPQYSPFLQHQQPYAQGSAPIQFPIQMPNQQAYQQPNPYQQMPPNVHINPLLFAQLQQWQQQPQQQAQTQMPNQAMNFDQVKAQLDVLRQLNNGNQGPRPT